MESPFRFSNAEPQIPDSPQSLFNDLKREEIKFLWAHQNDLLKEYQSNHLNTSDVALELPTGAGKTLIGLLISEWRRRKDNLRTVYLCPTRQLAYQVGNQAAQYGIKAHALVGPQKDYDPISFAQYTRGETIAITTYSGLFNVNPRINNPQLIVLDDAHAAENYIPSMWAVEINRRNIPETFIALIDVLKGALPDQFIRDIRGDNYRYAKYGNTECVPLPLLYSRINTIQELLDEKLHDTDLVYPWSMIRNNLHACHIYIDWNQMIIRPIIPPTFSHQPFKDASQRLYMSATLGEGGELERSLGVKRITRLPIPENWDKQTGGRRLILFPSLGLEENDIADVICAIKFIQARVLVLCPDNSRAQSARDLLANCNTAIEVFTKDEIEASMSTFLDSTDGALVLTNRYDGIDLPDEACRFEIVFEEPAATNLQERFYLERLKANLLLQNRIQTRISQALGRCVRSSNDYALVLMIGEKLANFCAKSEVLESFHPELQAEIDFGLSNSMRDDLSTDNFAGMANIFYAQGEQWNAVNADIISRRAKAIRKPADSLIQLASAAFHEVAFADSLWQGDFDEAQVQGQNVIDILTGKETISYRGWWYYLAGSVAWIRGKTKDDSPAFSQATDFFRHAVSSVRAISWLIQLQRLSIESEEDGKSATNADLILAQTIEHLLHVLTNLGRGGGKFEKNVASFEEQIGANDSTNFELGLAKLGNLLGYESERPNQDGAPDGIWKIPNLAYVLFEAKSEQQEDAPIGKNDTQQTKGHLEWLHANRADADNLMSFSVMISPRIRIDPLALPHAEGVYICSLDEIRLVSQKIVSLLRDLRAFSGDNFDEALLGERAARNLEEFQLDPKSIVNLLIAKPLKNMSSV